MNRWAPRAAAPRTMRRTIEILSSSVDEPALAITRRTSFPERGLTMRPIEAGAAVLADPTQCVTNVVLVRQPVEDELPATRPLDEPFDISREPLVHELLDRAALAICDVTVDPCLAVGAGHTAGGEVDGEAGQMGDGVA